MAVYAVEQRREGFWTPAMVCEAMPEQFRRLLGYLKRESMPQFGVNFEDVRVKRELPGVKPTWIFDGVIMRPLEG